MVLSPADATVFCMREGEATGEYQVSEVQFHSMEEFLHEFIQLQSSDFMISSNMMDSMEGDMLPNYD